MAEPLTLTAVAFAAGHFVWEHSLAHTVGGEAHDLYREFIERWRDGIIGQPRNHDIEESSEKALRGAALVLVLELAGRIEPKKSWISHWAEKLPCGGILTRDLFPGEKTPHLCWINALRAAICDKDFQYFHRYLKLREDKLQECFAKGNICDALGEGFGENFLAWARSALHGHTEHPEFAELVLHGWSATRSHSSKASGIARISTGLMEKGGHERHTPYRGRITLAQLYCLFFREHLKTNPKVFRILIADTLTALGAKFDTTTSNLTAELKALRDEVNALAKAPAQLDFTAFETWLEPQLTTIDDLLGDARSQLDAVAAGQNVLAAQQDEILVAIVTLKTEIQRGNDDATTQIRLLHGWLEERLKGVAIGIDELKFGQGKLWQKVEALPEQVIEGVVPANLATMLDRFRKKNVPISDRIWPVSAKANETRIRRGLGESPTKMKRSFPVGSSIQIVIEVEKDQHLLLLDEGPESIIYCLCPSLFAPDSALRTGRHILPAPQSKYACFDLTGSGYGRERVLAVLTSNPLRPEWMPNDDRFPARVINSDDIKRLIADIESLAAGDWSVLTTDFDVTPKQCV